MTRRARGIGGLQQFAALPQFGSDRFARQHARPGRGQFERQWQAFDQATDVDDGGRFGRRHQIRVHAVRGTHEQAHCIKRFQAILVLGFRTRQPIERQQPLVRQRQPHTRGDDELDARTSRQQRFEPPRAVDELLEVVEHQQQVALRQRGRDLVHRLGSALERDVEFMRDAATEFLGRREIIERNEDRTVGKAGGQLVHRAARHTRLADAARPDDAQQPAIVLRHQRGNPAQLDDAAHEAFVHGDGLRLRHAHNNRGRRVEQLLQRPQLGPRLQAQLIAQPCDKCVVSLTRPRDLPGPHEPFHVEAQCRFIERIGVEQSRREVDGLGRCHLAAEVLRRCGAPGRAQAIALEVHPA